MTIPQNRWVYSDVDGSLHRIRGKEETERGYIYPFICGESIVAQEERLLYTPSVVVGENEYDACKYCATVEITEL